MKMEIKFPWSPTYAFDEATELYDTVSSMSPSSSVEVRLAQLAQEAGWFFWTARPSKAAYFLKEAFYYRPWRMKSGLLALKSALRMVSGKNSTKNLGSA